MQLPFHCWLWFLKCRFPIYLLITQHFLVDSILVKQHLASRPWHRDTRREHLFRNRFAVHFTVTQCAWACQLEVTTHSPVQPVNHWLICWIYATAVPILLWVVTIVRISWKQSSCCGLSPSLKQSGAAQTLQVSWERSEMNIENLKLEYHPGHW